MAKVVSLADIRIESRLKAREHKDNCVSLGIGIGIEYIGQRQDETDVEKSARHHKLNTAIANKRKQNARANYSPQKRKHVQDANAAAHQQHNEQISHLSSERMNDAPTQHQSNNDEQI